MPKLKTLKSAAKRFTRTKSGKFLRSKSFRGHLKTAKTAKRRRNLRRKQVLTPGDARRALNAMPYS
jgi:large subunit ribosomal protein L35